MYVLVHDLEDITNISTDALELNDKIHYSNKGRVLRNFVCVDGWYLWEKYCTEVSPPDTDIDTD